MSIEFFSLENILSQVLPIAADINSGVDNLAVAENVVKQAIGQFGSLQVLVNNAQASASGVSIAAHMLEQFDLAIYSGLYAAFVYMKAVYPYLKESQGSVINFASGAGLFGNYGQTKFLCCRQRRDSRFESSCGNRMGAG